MKRRPNVKSKQKSSKSKSELSIKRLLRE